MIDGGRGGLVDDLGSVGPPAATDLEAPRAPARSVWGFDLVDLVAAVVLLVLGYLVRRRGLPTDGLWYDDAWVAAGAAKANVGELLEVSTNHPGFTAVLMAWARVVSPRSELMAWPELAVGVVTAPLTYLVLRRWRITREVAVLVCAALVVSTAHVQYSVRVKSYVVEALVVLALAVALPRLARITWRTPTVVAWVVAAALLGTVSAFALAASAVAMLVLVVHPQADRRFRLVALGVQGIIQVVYLRTVQATFDSELLTNDWETVYNGYIELHRSPTLMVKQVVSHVSRVGQALVGGRGVVPFLVVVVAIVGLGLAAWKGPRRITARYLLALPVLAFVGSIAKVIPFGPSNAMLFSPGWRASLWLLPSLVAGLAFALDAAFRVVVERAGRTAVPIRVGLVVGAGVLVVTGWGQPMGQPLSGSRSAAEYVETKLGSDGRCIMFGSRIFPYAAEPVAEIAVDPAPDTANGWTPRVLDERIWLLGSDPWDGSLGQLEAQVRGHDRIIVHNGLPTFGDGQLPALEAGLRELGYVKREDLLLGGSVGVARWERG